MGTGFRWGGSASRRTSPAARSSSPPRTPRSSRARRSWSTAAPWPQRRKRGRPATWLMIEQMGVFEAARPMWAWGSDLLPEDRPRRYLVGAVMGSMLLHLLVVVAVLFTGWLHNPVIANHGDLLFVEPTPSKTEEPTPPAPPDPPAPPERVKPQPTPLVPRVAASRTAPQPQRAAVVPPPALRAPEPRAAQAPPTPATLPPPAREEPAYEGRNAQEPTPTRTVPAPETPPRTPATSSETALASVPPPAPTFSSPIKGSGSSGSYYQGSQGGVVGQPVP